MSPTNPRHAVAVIAAAAAQLNDEIAIVWSAAIEAATDDDDERTCAALCDIRASAQRCAYMAQSLAVYAHKQGARASAATVERLTEGT